MDNTKRVRITNDSGRGYQTKVTNIATGEYIPNITHISLDINPCREIRAKIETAIPIIDIVADAEISISHPKDEELPPQMIGPYTVKCEKCKNGIFVGIEDDARNSVELTRNDAIALCAYLKRVYGLDKEQEV